MTLRGCTMQTAIFVVLPLDEQKRLNAATAFQCLEASASPSGKFLENMVVQRRLCGVWPKARKFVAVCAGGVLLHSGLAGEALLHRSVDAGPGSSSVQPTVPTCILGKQPNQDGPSPASVELSRKQLHATLHCSGEGYKVVPNTTTNVCKVEKDAKVKACADDENNKQITLQHLLGAKDQIEWTRTPIPDPSKSKPPDNGEAWTLQLQHAQLPLSDKTFFVGCQKENEEATQCKLTVNVKAKPSSVINNVVTCAYGQDSNEDGPVEVSLTAENSTLELVCGTEGIIRPDAYQTRYCEDAGLQNCKNSYSDILPNFDKSWWEGTEKSPQQAQLRIPPTGFPGEDQSFYIGCDKNKTMANKRQAELKSEVVPEPPVKPSACRVLVTIKAASVSSATMAVTRLVAATSGVAAVTGILVGVL
ncbi:SAG-related sequence [Besnoitia besnoiti]|uniref:SAG-related sequence n=1 Tax=Besnoitia besnoiti TaxID=94643 RepID=A0A2A9ML48_BESBE|nr:SAG-related sequence [Besnoitia besnoiti]PFH36162.1 SAG-related sequence [Besnoitia besnoiti]